MHDRRRPECAALLPALPAIGAWGCLAVGFLFADRFDIVSARVCFAVALIVGCVALTVRGRASMVALALGAMVFGAGYFQYRTLPESEPKHAPMRIGERAIVIVEGTLREDPRHGPPNPGAFASFVNLPPVARFTLRAEHLTDGAGGRAVNGDMFIRISETVAHVGAGDRVRISGFFSPVRPPMNPGERDGRRWASQENVIGRLFASSRDNVTVLPRHESIGDRVFAAWVRAKARLRSGAAAWLNDATDGSSPESPGRAALAALLLGDREEASMRELSQAMQRIGVAHLLSISGLHLGALVWLMMIALRGMGVRGGVEAIIVALVVLLYMTLIPVRTPIVRAGIMALAYLGAEAAGRRYHPLAILAWTGVVVLLWRPLELWSPGFQLSFGVVAAILVLPARVERRLRPIDLEPDAVTVRQWLMRKFEQAVIVAFCAWLVATPLIVHHFGVFSVFGAAASLALFPLVVLVIGVGSSALLLAALLPSASRALGFILEWTSEIIARVTLWMDDSPVSALHVPPTPTWWTVLATVVVIYVLAITRWRARRDAMLLGAAAIALAAPFAPFARPSVDALRIDTFSVDDGACHVVRSGRDAMLWDAGSRLLWFGERDLPRALRELNAWPIRTIVLSHPNLDHYSAIPDLIAPFGVREVIVGQGTIDAADEDPFGPVAHLLRELRRRGVGITTVAAGDSIKLGDVSVKFIHPAPDERWRNRNDGSLVAVVRAPTRAGDRTILLCGDIERAAMDALRRREPELRPDVIEAPHHGSARPFAIRFVESLDPSVVIQSTGLQRAGDDRWDHVRAGRTWLTTATDGCVTLKFDRDGTIRTRTMRSPVWRTIIAGSDRSTDTTQERAY